MGLIGVREQSQRFGSIGQGTPFVLADLIEYLVEKGHGLLIVFVGAQDAKRSESTKPPIGGGFHGRRWQTWLFPPMVPCRTPHSLHSSRGLRRTDKGDGFALVSSVDTKILPIDRDHVVARIKLAHADEAKVSEIGLTVGIAIR